MKHVGTEVEAALERRVTNGAGGGTVATRLAAGAGWSVDDVVCSRGPDDHPFEERHGSVSVSLVLCGTFQYRAGGRWETLVPGSVLLGNEGQCFECGHEHASGDRCVAFRYSPEYFDEIRSAVGASGSADPFRASRLPPLPDLSGVVALTNGGLLGAADVDWEELGLDVAARALRLTTGAATARRVRRATTARVTEAVRRIESDPTARLTLETLAAEAGLSPFHFLRTFKRVTGVTPHQLILRARLRHAATRIVAGQERIIDVALDAGFGDLSNFNRAFRRELGVAPTTYRASGQRGRRGATESG